MKLPPKYLSVTSTQTLREGLAELRALEANVTEEVVTPKLADSLEAHDAVHVLFGCDISDEDEMVAHGWMAFGTNIGMAKMHAMTANSEHRHFATGFARGQRALVVLKTLPRILRAAWRSRKNGSSLAILRLPPLS